MRRIFHLLALLVATWATAASAGTITYAISGTMTGQLAGNWFTNQFFTFTTVADTDDVAYESYFGQFPTYSVPSKTTFSFTNTADNTTYSGELTGLFNGNATFGASSVNYGGSPNLASVGIGEVRDAVGNLSITSALFIDVWNAPLYDLSTDIVLTGPGQTFDGGGVPFDTTLGTLIFQSYLDAEGNGFAAVEGPATFTAKLSSAPVPEIDPAGMGSVMALVTGALGLVERRRRLS